MMRGGGARQRKQREWSQRSRAQSELLSEGMLIQVYTHAHTEAMLKTTVKSWSLIKEFIHSLTHRGALPLN